MGAGVLVGRSTKPPRLGYFAKGRLRVSRSDHQGLSHATRRPFLDRRSMGSSASGPRRTTGIPRWVLFKLDATAVGAEVIGPPLVVTSSHCVVGIDHHPADRIGRIFSGHQKLPSFISVHHV